MATDFVLDADTGYNREELPPVPIRVDGKVYSARCPKDSLPVLMSRLSSVRFEEDPSAAEHLVQQILLSIFDEPDADELMSRLMDMTERTVTLAYIVHVVGLVAAHYETDLEEHFASMGTDNPMRAQTPANRAARRQLDQGKLPPRKAAAKKTATKKTAAKA